MINIEVRLLCSQYYRNSEIRNTITQAPEAESSRFPENQAMTAADTSAAIPQTGLAVIENIAGTVITDKVTYGR